MSSFLLINFGCSLLSCACCWLCKFKFSVNRLIFFGDKKEKVFVCNAFYLPVESANMLCMSRVQTAMRTLGQCHPFRDTRDFSLRDLGSSPKENFLNSLNVTGNRMDCQKTEQVTV